MRKTAGVIFLIFAAGALFAQTADSRLGFSGVFDSTVRYAHGSGGAPANSFGVEEYANFRLRLEAGEKTVLNAAFDLAALSGSYASSGGASPENFTASIELERLYLRINGDYVDAEAGLLRIPIGYGQVWASSDFLNPRNPLSPNARPRGVLGAAFSFYPAGETKLMLFMTAPKNPLEISGGGYIPGLSVDQHWERASLQLLYAYETPLEDTQKGRHRFGLSFKTDIVLGILADGLYTLDADNPNGINGLSFGAGFDYSFLDGNLYTLAEYLFNGSMSSTSIDGGGSRVNCHYLYGSALYRFSDFGSFSLSAVFCFDDLSFQPIAAFDYELFQGFALNISVNVPLDQKVLSGGAAGELGPLPSGSSGGANLLVTAGVKLRF